jgi:hypothetical protein
VKCRRLDPWRVPAGAPAEALLGRLEAILLERERAAGLRQRARRAVDLRRWRAVLAAIGCDLAWNVLTWGADVGVAVPSSYRNRPVRYRHPHFGHYLPTLLDLMEAAGVAGLQRAPGPRGVAVCFAGPTLLQLIRTLGMGREHLGRSTDRSDPVVLTRNTKDGRHKRRTWLDYEETAETAALRDEIVRINRHLAAADIGFEEDGQDPPDLQDRWLCRRFVVRAGEEPRFDQCGRLFGGFFQTPLPKSRRGGLRIDGEPTVTLDFSSAFLRIALAEKGLAPRGDLYQIPGAEDLTRAQIKAAVSALFFASPRMSRWPDEFTSGAAPLPPHWTPKRFRELLLAKYPVLTDDLRSCTGYRLMNTESRIMVALLLELAERGITALPLHDAVIVPASQAEVTRGVMESTSLAMTGAVIPVRPITLKDPPPFSPLPFYAA